MRRFPKASSMEPLDIGCGGMIILIFLLGACPPLGIIFLLIYGLIQDNIGFDNLYAFLTVIAIVFIAVMSPVLTAISIYNDGFITTWNEYWYFVLITLAESIIFLLWFIPMFRHKANSIKADKTKISDVNFTIQGAKCGTENISDLNLIGEKSEIDLQHTNTFFDKDEIVFVTPNGKRYHRNIDCFCVNRRSDLVKLFTHEAEQKGYSPCRLCYKETERY